MGEALALRGMRNGASTDSMPTVAEAKEASTTKAMAGATEMARMVAMILCKEGRMT